MILKSACSYNASYIDRLISVFMRSLQKMVREHLSSQQANPGVNETSTGAWMDMNLVDHEEAKHSHIRNTEHNLYNNMNNNHHTSHTHRFCYPQGCSYCWLTLSEKLVCVLSPTPVQQGEATRLHTTHANTHTVTFLQLRAQISHVA